MVKYNFGGENVWHAYRRIFYQEKVSKIIKCKVCGLHYCICQLSLTDWMPKDDKIPQKVLDGDC